MDRRSTGRCPRTGKVRFRDHEAAVEALHRAVRARHWAGLEGSSTRRHEVRAYRCEACRGWHLTSAMTWTPDRRPAALGNAPQQYAWAG